jgi:hypothetical protein
MKKLFAKGMVTAAIALATLVTVSPNIAIHVP